jgi:hypothetical protein
MTPAQRDATRKTITFATTAKTPVHQRQLRLRIGDGGDTASRKAAAMDHCQHHRMLLPPLNTTATATIERRLYFPPIEYHCHRHH